MQVPNKYFRALSMVYMMTNMEVMNEVIAFNRDKNGILTYSGSYPTYGRGAGPKEVSLQHQTVASILLRHKAHYLCPVMAVFYLQLMQAAIVSVASSYLTVGNLFLWM